MSAVVFRMHASVCFVFPPFSLSFPPPPPFASWLFLFYIVNAYGGSVVFP